MPTKLYLLPLNGGAFNCLPAREISLDDEKILCNNVIMPWGFNPHSVRLWVIGNEFGALCAVWADCEQDALDEAVDANFLDSLQVDADAFAQMTEDEQDGFARLGNASEPFDLANVWIQPSRLSEKEDCQLLCALSYASGAGQTTLYS
jgi:hypothetical protein